MRIRIIQQLLISENRMVCTTNLLARREKCTAETDKVNNRLLSVIKYS